MTVVFYKNKISVAVYTNVFRITHSKTLDRFVIFKSIDDIIGIQDVSNFDKVVCLLD